MAFSPHWQVEALLESQAQQPDPMQADRVGPYGRNLAVELEAELVNK